MALYLGWKLIKYYERAAGKKFPAVVVLPDMRRLKVDI